MLYVSVCVVKVSREVYAIQFFESFLDFVLTRNLKFDEKKKDVTSF